MAHEVFWWHKRLDTKTLPEAILAVLWVLHKNLSCSFDLFSLGSKMEPGGLLFEEVPFQWGEKPCRRLSVIFSIFMLDFRQICLCYLTQRRRKENRTRCPCDPLCTNSSFPQQIKCLSRKFDWDFVWPLNWVDRAKAWLPANTTSNVELESRGSIDLPVTFTWLA